jgi:hypothetical protein
MTRFPRALEKAIFERDNEICQICGRTTEFGDGEIEHKIPTSKGGSDDPENLQWACHRCNKLKGNTRTNEQVRKMLSLPEDFGDIMKFRTERKGEKLPPPITQNKLPTLSRENLDIPAVEKCINSLQESYQSETIIDEVCNKITAVEEPTKEFVHIGFHYRFPRLWFLPYEVTNQCFCNEVLFSELGREIAIGEQKYLEDSILGNKTISRVGLEFSPKGILKAINEMQARGLKPNIITFPLRFWTTLHQWSGNAKVEYNVAARVKLNATLVIDGNRLRIINPLGAFPREPMLLGQNAVEWVVKRNVDGALYVVFGNHQLYPLKYIELLTGISVKSVINPEEISILDFS